MPHHVHVLTPFAPGSYRSLVVPGRPFSAGVVADPGFDLVHAVFHRPVPLAAGLDAAARHVEAGGRPVTAIAAFELRIPAPLGREAFDAFNRPYAERLAALGLESGGELVAARTNVAPTIGGVAEPSVHAFTYTVPGRGRPATAFRLSGATETRLDGSPGDRLRSIVEVLEDRLAALGASWTDATAIGVYGAASEGLVDVGESFGGAGLRGLTWFPSRPPIDGFDFEIDASGVGAELVV
jgi:hypothetical protein